MFQPTKRLIIKANSFYPDQSRILYQYEGPLLTKIIGDGLVRTTSEGRDISFSNALHKNSSLTPSSGNNYSEQRKKPSRNRLEPDERAIGDHSVIKRNNDGKIVKYETYRLQTDHHNPTSWESVKRYNGPGSKTHFNKFSEQYINAPHIHDPYCPGEIRPATPWEIPK